MHLLLLALEGRKFAMTSSAEDWAVIPVVRAVFPEDRQPTLWCNHIQAPNFTLPKVQAMSVNNKLLRTITTATTATTVLVYRTSLLSRRPTYYNRSRAPAIEGVLDCPVFRNIGRSDADLRSFASMIDSLIPAS